MNCLQCSIKNSLKVVGIKYAKLISRSNSSLVIAEHDNVKLSEITQSALTAAKQIGDEVTVLVVGTQCKSAADEVSRSNVAKRVLISESPNYDGFLPENLANIVVDAQKKFDFTHIIASSSSFSKNLLPRVALKLDVSPISDVIEIKNDETFTRGIYAGNAIQTITSIDPIKILTIRSTNFEKDQLSGGSATLEEFEGDYPNDMSSFIGQDLSKSDRPDLTSAKVVISGGRGLKSSDNFKLLYELADKFGGAVGASRAAVDAGFVSNDLQIGQTGKIVAPELYIAIGISGAIQHVAGMKDSKTIVAINTDGDAPIFKIADYGLVGDLFKIIPELISKI